MGRGAVRRLVPAGKRAPKAGARPVTSLKQARKITSAYHSILYAKARAAGDAPRLAALAGELAALGGLETYQAASALSTSAFRSSRWIFKQLTGSGLQPARGALPLRVLELGATNAQLAVCPWLRVRAIDLMSRDPAVEAKDFFDVPVGSGPSGAPADVAPAAPAAAGAGGGGGAGRDRVWGASPSRLRPCAAWGVEAGAYLPPRALPGVGAVAQLQCRASSRPPTTGCYDIVVNNLVLNCVAEPQARVRMLVACRDHLVPGGLLFFALPSRCLDASAFLARKTVEGLLAALGLAQRAYRQTPKISFYLFQRVDVLPAEHLLAPAAAAAAAAAAPAAAPLPPPPARPSPTHGAGWRPVISARDAAEEAWLRRALAHPPVQRSAGAAGLTEFSLSVEPAWVVAAAAPPAGSSR